MSYNQYRKFGRESMQKISVKISKIQKYPYLNQYLLSETIEKPYNNNICIASVAVLINMY